MGNELIIGDKLRQARLNKNISIDELQKKTKIQKRYLEAIEQGKFDLLPGEYYVRAFLREYASVVGVDGDYLVAVFDGEADLEKPAPKRVAPEVVHGSRVRVTEKQPKTLLDYLPMILLGMVALTIVIIVGYMMWQDRQATPMIGNEKPSVVVEQTSTTTTKEATSSSEPVETTSSSQVPKMDMELVDSKQNQATIEVTEAKDPLELVFKGKNERCWIGILVNGEYVYQYTLLADEEQAFTLPEGATNATITLGASGNVDITANGEKVPFDDPQFELLQKDLQLTISYQE
ncbi:helix-turn-helix domain-containing protein [Enterococcus saccharolyticus]|uniref:Transcriptional regulator n=1 Tax=Candidatus Enterococcus willemsii TaxID=1857215 RepID=A0ABQ6Z084_9ENTE|nr:MULTISPECIES: RodZ domain-containing protein [Enterococcus]KAF1304074.1 transcriptional regulator [Enterococcus sp. CU12B]MCD5002065.1 helix-turn-helix domain-containing protein [Enterococcus saccharolyticus]